jgi:hypothetical protein
MKQPAASDCGGFFMAVLSSPKAGNQPDNNWGFCDRFG